MGAGQATFGWGLSLSPHPDHPLHKCSSWGISVLVELGFLEAPLLWPFLAQGKTAWRGRWAGEGSCGQASSCSGTRKLEGAWPRCDLWTSGEQLMPGALRGQPRQEDSGAPLNSPLAHGCGRWQLIPGLGARGNRLETTSGQCPLLSLSLSGNGALGEGWPGRLISANEAEG